VPEFQVQFAVERRAWVESGALGRSLWDARPIRILRFSLEKAAGKTGNESFCRRLSRHDGRRQA
jgi:hypothetical protein